MKINRTVGKREFGCRLRRHARSEGRHKRIHRLLTMVCSFVPSLRSRGPGGAGPPNLAFMELHVLHGECPDKRFRAGVAKLADAQDLKS